MLDRMIDEAASGLQAATGGAALCRITASGSPGWSAKRAEGRWVADLARWSAQPDSSWVPYCEGGLQGLAEFAAAVSDESLDQES